MTPITFTVAGAGTVTISFTAAVQTFGKGDNGTYVPPNYEPALAPPQLGATLVDPVFGGTIRRLTNLGVSHDYSSKTPINYNNTMVLVGTGDGYWMVVGYPSGRIIMPKGSMPFAGTPSALWSPSNPNTLYYITNTAPNSQLRAMTIDPTTSGSFTNVLLHNFTEYSYMSFGGDEGDMILSDYIFLDAKRVSDGGKDLFIYQISKDSKGNVLPAASNYDAGYILPDGHRALIAMGTDTLYDFSTNPPKPVMVEVNQANHQTVFNWNGHNYVAFADGAGQFTNGWGGVCTMDLDIGPSSVKAYTPYIFGGGYVHCHSDRSNHGWTVWSVCMAKVPGYASYPLATNWSAPPSSQHQTGGANGYWGPTDGEIILMKADCSKIVRIAHHRSRPNGVYSGKIPFASISPDGNVVIFNSDFGQGATAPYDVYAIDVSALAGNL